MQSSGVLRPHETSVGYSDSLVWGRSLTLSSLVAISESVAMRGPRRKAYYARPDNFTTSCSIPAAMGFRRMDPTYAKFTSILRIYASRFLDKSLLLQQQDRKQWQSFVSKVVRKAPFISDYEDYWPIEEYVRRWLYDTRRSGQKQGEKSPITHVRGDQDEESQTSGTSETGSRQIRSNRKPVGTYRSQSREILPSAPSSSSDSSTTHSRTTTAPTSLAGTVAAAPQNQASSFAGESPFEPCEEFVRDFLQALPPGMGNLVARFINAGLVNRSCFIALAGMPDWEKDKLLRDDMSLTAFQMRAVRVGLAGLN
ncbi:hypothetical protein DAEQUDRAFT_814948 [Daedalea quercina L-15889]|uniref:Uncharacterized protein n=1 Tax=Daedalea quercina L-15889 TaxID=1314783 RepID=A0A165LJD0_9APHY|nr:hypothetical protein DAEQUDRAFT_814948 [Daedalea quercina L-15889]